MSTVNATSSATAANSGYAASVLPQQTLTQDDFLKLLIAQMTSQDPMNPMSNEDFMAQMAQFSTLEQTRALGQEISQMRTDQQILQANALIGQTVELRIDDTHTGSGIVSAVQINDGTPKIVVDGTAYDLSQVLSIAPTVPAP
jgi:flagellar basal-body rod modification protein FlgD